VSGMRRSRTPNTGIFYSKDVSAGKIGDYDNLKIYSPYFSYFSNLRSKLHYTVGLLQNWPQTFEIPDWRFNGYYCMFCAVCRLAPPMEPAECKLQFYRLFHPFPSQPSPLPMGRYWASALEHTKVKRLLK
jgi:hypothetical protein